MPLGKYKARLAHLPSLIQTPSSIIFLLLPGMLASIGTIVMLSLSIAPAAIQPPSDLVARSTTDVRSGTVSTIFYGSTSLTDFRSFLRH